MREKLINFLIGGMIFALGDLTSQLIAWLSSGHPISVSRLIGMLIVSSTLYPIEIESFFRWMAETTFKVKLPYPLGFKVDDGYKLSAIGRTLGATLFFNPLWIARHFTFIALFQGDVATIQAIPYFLESLRGATLSFIYGLPIALIGNYVVQGKLPLNRRFIGSAILTLVFAIYYGMMSFIL